MAPSFVLKSILVWVVTDMVTFCKGQIKPWFLSKTFPVNPPHNMRRESSNLLLFFWSVPSNWSIKYSLNFAPVSFHFFKFSFGLELIYNIVLVSSVHQSGSVMNIHIYILFWILFQHILLCTCISWWDSAFCSVSFMTSVIRMEDAE